MLVADPVAGFRELSAQPPPAAPVPGRLQGAGLRLLRDHGGNLWVSTQGQGLWFVKASTAEVENVGTHDGLSVDTVGSLFEDREGNVWAGTQIGLLYKFAQRRVTPLTDIAHTRVVEAGTGGEIWVGTSAGLVRFSGMNRRLYGAQDGLPSSDIRVLHVDRSGMLWVGTTSGIVRVSGRFVPLRLEQRGWPTRSIAMTTDLSGGLWICDQDEVCSMGGWPAHDRSLADITRTMIDSVA